MIHVVIFGFLFLLLVTGIVATIVNRDDDHDSYNDDYYWYDSSYKEWVGYDKALKVYYEDNIDELAQKIVDFGGVKL